MTRHPAVSNGGYDVARVREDFPALALKVYGKPLVYLDNAASAQKPNAVLDRMSELAPRAMRRAWTAAFGNARLGGRDTIEPGDLPDANPKRGPIGFVTGSH